MTWHTERMAFSTHTARMCLTPSTSTLLNIGAVSRFAVVSDALLLVSACFTRIAMPPTTSAKSESVTLSIVGLPPTISMPHTLTVRSVSHHRSDASVHVYDNTCVQPSTTAHQRILERTHCRVTLINCTVKCVPTCAHENSTDSRDRPLQVYQYQHQHQHQHHQHYQQPQPSDLF
jgi:hypothetical protein